MGCPLLDVSARGCRHERVRASALRQRVDGVLLSVLEGVMLAVDKNFSMLGKVTSACVCGPRTRPEHYSDD